MGYINKIVMNEETQIVEPSSSSKTKRKRIVLKLRDKIDISIRLEKGESHVVLMSEYNIGKSTLYSIINNRDKILEYYCETESDRVCRRKVLARPKLKSLDDGLYEWFKGRQAEGAQVTGPALVEKAKALYAELQLTEPCDFSTGWLTRFKDRHGITRVEMCGAEVKSAKAEWTQIQNYFQEKQKDPKKKTRRKRKKLDKDDPLSFLHSPGSENFHSSNGDQDKHLIEIHEHKFPYEPKLMEIKKEIDNSKPTVEFVSSFAMDQEMESPSSSKDTRQNIDRSLNATIPMDQFFTYMYEKTKLLPINIQLDIKRKIFNVVCDAEKEFISNSLVSGM